MALLIYLQMKMVEYNEEIKHAFSWLLQNNLRGGEMLLEIEKPRHFNTKEVILQPPQEQVLISILPQQQNRADRLPL